MHERSVPMPGRYATEIAVMQEMNWSWAELQEAPYDLVEEVLVRRGFRVEYEAKRRVIDQQKEEQRAKASRTARRPSRSKRS